MPRLLLRNVDGRIHEDPRNIEMRFKLRHMEVFRAVMVSGSINGAAKLLHTSQPGLSKSLAHLEQSLGLALFKRTSSALVPTKEAHILFSEISKVYDAAVQIDELVEQLKNGQRGRLAVATSPSFALTLLPQAIKLFKERRPEGEVFCRSITVADAGNEILGKRSEVVISTLPIVHPHLTCQELFVSRVVCLVHRSHPLATFPSIDLSQIAEYPMISYDRESLFGKLLRDAFEKLDIPVKSTVSVTRTEQACALVQAGVGVSFASSFSVGPGLWTNVIAKPIHPVIEMPVTAIHSSFEKLSVQAEEFLQVVKAVAAQN